MLWGILVAASGFAIGGLFYIAMRQFLARSWVDFWGGITRIGVIGITYSILDLVVRSHVRDIPVTGRYLWYVGSLVLIVVGAIGQMATWRESHP